MSEEKDDLNSIKVYNFNNTKENWHEFALKFRVIAYRRGYYGVIDGKWNPKTREDKVEVYTKFLNYKLENTRQRHMDWITSMEKKRAELMNTGHIMDDETFITDLLNSLPQTEYEGAILVIKDKLRKGPVEIPEIEQVLEDKLLKNSSSLSSRSPALRGSSMLLDYPGVLS